MKEEFNQAGIIKVKATFNDYIYHGILANMGTGCHIIGVRKDIRKAIEKGVGDMVEVTVTEDTSSRLLATPDMLKNALSNNLKADDFFNSLTDSQKNKFINHIISAKKAETRQRRLTKVINMLNNNEKMK